jgi:hypothetical protein
MNVEKLRLEDSRKFIEKEKTHEEIVDDRSKHFFLVGWVQFCRRGPGPRRFFFWPQKKPVISLGLI